MNVNPNNIKRGDVVLCKLYNIVGIVFAESIHYNGMLQFEVMPKCVDNEKPNPITLDAPALEKTEDDILKPIKALPPRCKITVGINEEAEDKSRNMKGIITEITTSLSGNVTATLALSTEGDNKHHYCSYQALTGTNKKITASRTETGCMNIKTASNL